MPTRILREGILDSRAVNSLSEEAELLYRRLYSIVDDYGRFEFDPELIRARVFMRQMERWNVDRIHRVLLELTVDHGFSPLVTVYLNGNKKYFQINKFGQRCQSKPKCPDPQSPESTVVHRDPPPSRVESKTNIEISEKVLVVVQDNKFSPPTPSKQGLEISNTQLQEVCAGFDRHLKHSNREPRDLIIQNVMSMNGEFDWELFRERHAPYCEHFGIHGWRYCTVTFWGWIQAGMPPAEAKHIKSKLPTRPPYNPGNMADSGLGIGPEFPRPKNKPSQTNGQ